MADPVSDLIERTKALLARRPDLHYGLLAAHTTTDHDYLGKVLRGQKPLSERLAGELESLLKRAEAGEILKARGNGQALLLSDAALAPRRMREQQQLYQTTTVRCVAEALDYCADQAEIAIITGDFGVGKSAAMGLWLRGRGAHRRTLVLELHEFVGGNCAMFVHELATALGLPGGRSSQSGARIFADIVSHLRREPAVIIIDQAEIISVRVGQVIRQVWDRTSDEGTGIALLGAPLLVDKLRRSRARDLGALASRVGVWAALQGLSRPEMAGILKAEGIADLEPAALDLWWKAIGGSMRALTKSIKLVREKHAGKRVTERTVAGVAAHLWGMQIQSPQEGGR